MNINKAEFTTKYETHNPLSKMKITTISTLTMFAMMGCQPQSIQQAETNVFQTKSQLITGSPELAKTTLVKALKKQRTSSYDYHVNVLVSNDERRASLASATIQQLSMSDDPQAHCEHIHDEAYLQLLDRAEAEGLEIDDASYATTRQALKSTYLECRDNYDEWLSGQNGEEWSLIEDVADEDGYAMATLEDAETAAEEAIAAAEEAERAAVYDEDYDYMYDEDYDYAMRNDASMRSDLQFDYEQSKIVDYDDTHTKHDAHMANLLDAYLLKPLSITYEGGYRPLLGSLSIMPTYQYQTRNLNMTSSQFIYIDAKEAAVYIWADTFAFLLSSYIDEELGTSMHNKWIKLNMNDGSLPESFMLDLLKSHIQAESKVYDNSAVTQYKFLSADDVVNDSPVPDGRHREQLSSVNSIIERRLTEDEFYESIHLYLDDLYSTMSEKHPEVFTEFEANKSDNNVINSLLEYNLYKDYGVEKDSSEDEKEPVKINSRLIFNNIFKLIKAMKEEDQDRSEQNMDAETIGEDDNITVASEFEDEDVENLDFQGPAIEYAKKPKDLAEDKWVWRDLYGINDKQITWHLSQRQLANDDSHEKEFSELRKGLRLEALTRYTPASHIKPIFKFLPKGTTPPNIENTIDFNTYMQSLQERYEQGGGTMQGKELFELLDKIGFQIPETP